MPEKKSPPITVAEHDHVTEPATKRVLLYGWDGSNKVRVKAAADGTLASSAVLTASALPIVDRSNSSIGASVSSLTNSGALHTMIVDASGSQITSFGGGTQYATNSSRATFTGTVAMGFDGAQVLGLFTNSSGALYNANGGDGSVTGGSLTAYQGGAWDVTVSSLPVVTLSSLGVFQGTSPWITSSASLVSVTGGSLSVYQGTDAWNVVATGASFNANVTQGTAAWNVVATGASFNANVTQGTAAWNVVATGASFNVTPVPHTVYGTAASFAATVTQSANPWNVVATGASFNATVAAHTVYATAASFTATVSTGSLAVTVVNDAANSANWVSGTNASLIDTADYVIVTGSSGKKNYITHVLVQNSAASYSSWVTLKDGASTVLYNAYAPYGGGGVSITLPVPIVTTASYAFVAAASSSSVLIRVSASGFRGA